MECELNPRIPYTELSHIIKRQKEVSGPQMVPTREYLLPDSLNISSDYQEADREETEPDQEGLPRPHLLQRGCATDSGGEHSRHT